MSDSAPTSVLVPRGACAIIAARLAMVPLGIRHAASFPSRSAASRSSLPTVGSSPYTSSPSCADLIASRIRSGGSVNVSLRSSIIYGFLVNDDLDVRGGGLQRCLDLAGRPAGRDNVAEPVVGVAHGPHHRSRRRLYHDALHSSLPAGGGRAADVDQHASAGREQELNSGAAVPGRRQPDRQASERAQLLL